MISKQPTENHNSLDAKYKLKGLKVIRVLGRKLIVRPDKSAPWKSWYWARFLVLGNAWKKYKEQYKRAFSDHIQDWDTLTYEDLWRDPEIAFYVGREIHHG